MGIWIRSLLKSNKAIKLGKVDVELQPINALSATNQLQSSSVPYHQHQNNHTHKVQPHTHRNAGPVTIGTTQDLYIALLGDKNYPNRQAQLDSLKLYFKKKGLPIPEYQGEFVITDTQI